MGPWTAFVCTQKICKGRSLLKLCLDEDYYNLVETLTQINLGLLWMTIKEPSEVQSRMSLQRYITREAVKVV